MSTSRFFAVKTTAAPRSWCMPMLGAIVGFVLFSTPAAASPSLETFVLTVGGRSTPGPPGCTTFAVPTPVSDFFEVFGVMLPVGGLEVCGVEGSFQDLMSPTGPLTDNLSLDSVWTTNEFHGATAVTSNYGTLSAQAHAQFTGDFSSLNVTSAEGFAIADDGLTITTPNFPNGQIGSIVFRATVTGGLSTTSTGTAGVKVDYRVNAGSLFSMLRCSVDYATNIPSIYSVGTTGLDGFTLSPGAMSGSGEVSSASIPIEFGTSFDFKLGLFAYTVPALTSIVDSGFAAVITAIEVKGPGGESVTDFVITSASGTFYGGGGVTAVEESAPDGIGDFAHFSAFPNPARGPVQLRFDLRAPVGTSLFIHDLAGRLVRQLDVANAREGTQSVWWNGRSEEGVLVPEGIYFARLVGPEGTATTRVTLLR